VAVVSLGDDDLIIFDGREGWHFPQDSEGRYAGYHPANDSEAIQHLEALRSKGGEYFLLPQTSFWWLDHYTGLRSHLKHRYHSVWSDSDCIIYSLAERSNGVKRGDGVVSRVSEKIMKWLQR